MVSCLGCEAQAMTVVSQSQCLPGWSPAGVPSDVALGACATRARLSFACFSKRVHRQTGFRPVLDRF